MDCFEKARLESMLQYEKNLYQQGFQRIAGIDEAGRGPLAGPVVAAACILPPSYSLPYLNDSKQLTPKVRRALFEILINDPLISYGIGIIDSEEIDRVNIYQATKLAMVQAVQQLPIVPDYLLIDAMSLESQSIPFLKIIKGDELSLSIAAASVIAKETRDRMMEQYHEQWPCYGFFQHKGYGTKKHVEAIHVFGPCPIHRRTFEPIKTQIILNKE